jgi:cobalt transporter subunit CbtB
MFVFKKEFTMTETTTPTAISTTTTTATVSRSLVLQLAAGVALGLAVFYGVAFAESPLLHNAAHDVRHITVQPCH